PTEDPADTKADDAAADDTDLDDDDAALAPEATAPSIDPAIVSRASKLGVSDEQLSKFGDNADFILSLIESKSRTEPAQQQQQAEPSKENTEDGDDLVPLSEEEFGPEIARMSKELIELKQARIKELQEFQKAQEEAAARQQEENN